MSASVSTWIDIDNLEPFLWVLLQKVGLGMHSDAEMETVVQLVSLFKPDREATPLKREGSFKGPLGRIYYTVEQGECDPDLVVVVSCLGENLLDGIAMAAAMCQLFIIKVPVDSTELILPSDHPGSPGPVG